MESPVRNGSEWMNIAQAKEDWTTLKLLIFSPLSIMIHTKTRKKNPARGGVSSGSWCDLFSVAFLESVHAATGIEHFVLPGIERVRGT